MTAALRAREDSESGVVLVIFAIAMVVLLGMIAIAIDGSYGFVQNRRAQNASDFAAYAAAQALQQSTFCSGTNVPTGGQIAGIIQQLVTDNGSDIGTNWTAQFLNSQGVAIPTAVGTSTTTFTASNYPTVPPPGACGVSVSARPSWTPFFAGIFGIHQLKGFATAKVDTNTTGNPIGIVALNKSGPHEILGGGTGTFVVSGSIFANTDVSQQPWTQLSSSVQWDDAIDAKTSSNLYVYGPIDTVTGTDNGYPLWPLDWCFDDQPPNVGNTTNPVQYGGDPTAPGATLPDVVAKCSNSEAPVTVDYDSINNNAGPQISDPLTATDAPANPLNSSTNIDCPGAKGPTPQYGAIPQNSATLSPGEYTDPVELTGSVTFSACPGGYPGIYRFDKGLWINPQSSSDTVSGTNVVIATEAPFPVAGNIPGTLSGSTFSAALNTDGTEVGGNGAPCLPSSTMTSASDGQGDVPISETSITPVPNPPLPDSSACAGTNSTLYGAVAYVDSKIAPDPSMFGTGDNFSLMIGGVSGAQVNLTGPTTGPYAGTDSSPGIVLYQDAATQANYGFNAEAGDAATINLTGVVYNASLEDYGDSSPHDYWDGYGGGIPFYAGGTLQTGFGSGWTSSDGPTPSTGSVKITGTAIVDDFNTDGNTGITILGQPYKVPGSSSLSLIG
jgi:Flp pilus assembly protein TadG